MGIGRGTAAAAVLDWNKPVGTQFESLALAACPDVILAAECVWLAELVEPFAEAAAALLTWRAHADHAEVARQEERELAAPVLFLASRERACNGSETFAS